MSSDPAQIDALREKIRRIEAGERVLRGVLPFGVPDLDERLPGGGLALGALHGLDSRERPPRVRDIYIPDLHIDTLKLKPRNFR